MHTILSVAKELAIKHSDDPDTQVGVFFMDPKRNEPLAFGCNRIPDNIKKTAERLKRPTKYAFIEHAERHAIYWAGRFNIPLEGSVVYSTLFPCCDCARAIIQAGCIGIVSQKPDESMPRWSEQMKIAKTMFEEAGVKVTLID